MVGPSLAPLGQHGLAIPVAVLVAKADGVGVIPRNLNAAQAGHDVHVGVGAFVAASEMHRERTNHPCIGQLLGDKTTNQSGPFDDAQFHG